MPQKATTSTHLIHTMHTETQHIHCHYMDHRVSLYVSRATCLVSTSASISRKRVVNIRKKFSPKAQSQTNPFTNLKKKQNARSSYTVTKKKTSRKNEQHKFRSTQGKLYFCSSTCDMASVVFGDGIRAV